MAWAKAEFSSLLVSESFFWYRIQNNNSKKLGDRARRAISLGYAQIESHINCGISKLITQLFYKMYCLMNRKAKEVYKQETRASVMRCSLTRTKLGLNILKMIIDHKQPPALALSNPHRLSKRLCQITRLAKTLHTSQR